MQNGQSFIATCTLAFLLLLQGCNSSSPTAQTPEASPEAPTANNQCTDVGGNIIMTWKDDVSTLDPAIGYDWQNWSMIKSLLRFVGLKPRPLVGGFPPCDNTHIQQVTVSPEA